MEMAWSMHYVQFHSWYVHFLSTVQLTLLTFMSPLFSNGGSYIKGYYWTLHVNADRLGYTGCKCWMYLPLYGYVLKV
jgi:hypothetical protein